MRVSPEQAVVEAAVARGHLTQAQLREALLIREQLRAGNRPADLLAILAQRYLAPQAVAELQQVHQHVATGAAWSQGDTIVPEELAARSAQLAKNTPQEHDPAAVQQYLGSISVDRGAHTVSLAGGQQGFGASPAPKRDFLTGLPRQMGPYAIERELARGGMGAVFVARHTELDRRVALKVVLGMSGRALERFRTEARTTAKLRHPNIVALHEFGADHGQHYLVMDLVEGPSLQLQIAEQGTFDEDDAARIAGKLARALAYAHQNGVLHRDIKPSNVLMSPQGEPLLTDFGLAKDVAAEGNLTKTGQALGTPAYMPPEQARGNREQIGPRSDIYSLGATLYEMLTGHTPFGGDQQLNILVAVVRGEITRPSKHRAGLDRALEAICMRCLQREPENRYGSAAELAEDLEEWLAARVAGGPRAGGPRRGVTGVAFLGGLLLGAGGMALLGSQVAVSPSEREQPSSGGAQAPQGKAAAPSSEDPRWVALRAAPSKSAPLVEVVRERLAANDVLGLASLWEEVHRRLGGPAGLPLKAGAPGERRRALRALADPQAAYAARLRAAIKAPLYPDAATIAALRAVSNEADPILVEAAWGSLLHLDGEEVFSAWSRRAEGGLPLEGALQALSLLELSLQPRPMARMDLLRLARAGKGKLLRGALPLAILLSSAREGGISINTAQELFSILARDPDPFVAARTRDAKGAFTVLHSAPQAAAPEAVLRLARAVAFEPGSANSLEAGGGYDRALSRALKTQPTSGLWVLLAWDQVERGKLTRAQESVDRALALDGKNLHAVELRWQLKLLLEGVQPGGDDPVAGARGTPEALALARDRIAFTTRYGAPALPGPNGTVRITVGFAEGWSARGFSDAMQVFATLRVPSAVALEVNGGMYLRSRFSLSSWRAASVVGRSKSDKYAIAMAAPEGTALEGGLKFHVIHGGGLRTLVRRGRTVLALWSHPGLMYRKRMTATWGRGAAASFIDGRLVGRVAVPAQAWPAGGHLNVAHGFTDAGWIYRVLAVGRWSPGADPLGPRPPSHAEMRSWEASLQPAAGSVPVSSLEAEGTPATLGELRRTGLMIFARRRWLGTIDRAGRAFVRLRGDFDLTVRMSFAGGPRGVAAGLFARASHQGGDFVKLLVSGTHVRIRLQRGHNWDQPVAGLLRPAGKTVLYLNLRRVGDYLTARYGVTPKQLSNPLGRPLHFPMRGPVDVGIVASNYLEQRPFVPATFDQIELRVPRR